LFRNIHKQSIIQIY